MYYEVAKQLVLECPASGTVYEHSQPVAAEGTVNVAFEATLYRLGGDGTPSLTVALQESNDLENWTDSTTSPLSFATTMPDYVRSSLYDTSHKSNYYRLKYKLQETGRVQIALFHTPEAPRQSRGSLGVMRLSAFRFAGQLEVLVERKVVGEVGPLAVEEDAA